MDKKVSVIIPFFSHKDWLKEALDSVFSQTYQNFEVILVNDGSKEDINDIISNYDSRLIYLTQENAGPGAARNKGIKYATGDYIAFEDSDDIWMPTKLEKQIAFMSEINAKWSHTGFMYWWPMKNVTKIVDTSRDYDDIYIQRFITSKMATPSVVLDKIIFRDGNYSFPENIRNGEDGTLYQELSKRYKVALIEEPLVKVRMRGNNSQSHAIERFNIIRDNHNKLLNSDEKLPFFIYFRSWIYSSYAKLLGKKVTPMKEFIAKCLWTIPFFMERIYIRYYFVRCKKDEKYIKRFSKTDIER